VVDVIKAQPFVKGETVSFISRDEAAADMKAELGDESLLEEMPNLMHDIVRFNVQAAYFDQDSLLAWRTELSRDSAVADLHYQVANIGNVGRNIENLGWITLVLGFLLIFAAVALIHNTIRLALYANRFVIKSQELVGASWSFISRPYLVRGLLNGLWSALIAIVALIAVQSWAQRLVPDLRALEDVNLLLAVFAGLVAVGVLISGLSTYVVVNKFLRMRVDDLY
jgi:cell division transport system permease protein